MKKIILITLLLMQSMVLNAQGITGRVVDSNTGKAIESVTLISGGYATLSNIDGEFTLSQTQGDVGFSHVAYYPQSFSADNVPKVVRLVPKPIQMKNIEVKANSSLDKNIQSVWRKYRTVESDELSLGKESSSFYYRQTTKTDTLYTEYIESFFSGYRSFVVDGLSLQEGRYAAISSNVVECITLNNHYFFSQLFPAEYSIRWKIGAIQVPISFRYDKKYKISYIRSINQDSDDEVLVYRFEPRPPLPRKTAVIYGDIYVRSKDNAIIRFDGRCNNFVLSFGDARFRHLGMDLSFVITYVDAPQKKFPIVESVKTTANLSYSRILADKSFSDPINVRIESILFAIDWDFGEYRNSMGSSALSRKVLNSKYDPKFWENNPIIKRTAIEEKIIQDFTKLGYFGNFKLD